METTLKALRIRLIEYLEITSLMLSPETSEQKKEHDQLFDEARVFAETHRIQRIPCPAQLQTYFNSLVAELLEHDPDRAAVICSYFKHIQLRQIPEYTYKVHERIRPCSIIYTGPSHLHQVISKRTLDQKWLSGDFHFIVEAYRVHGEARDYCKAGLQKHPRCLAVFLQQILIQANVHNQSDVLKLVSEVECWKRPLRIQNYRKLEVRAPRLLTFDAETGKFDLNRLGLTILCQKSIVKAENKGFFMDILKEIRLPHFHTDQISCYPPAFRSTMKTMLLIWKRRNYPKDVLLSIVSHYILWNCFHEENPLFNHVESQMDAVAKLSRAEYIERSVRVGFLPRESPLHLPDIQIVDFILAEYDTDRKVEFTHELMNFYSDHCDIEPIEHDLGLKVKKMKRDEIIRLLRERKLKIQYYPVKRDGNIKKILNYLACNWTVSEIVSYTNFK